MIMSKPFLTLERTLKCEVCGRFVSYADIESGAATHKMVLPDSDLSIESYETLCPKCKAKEYGA